MEIDLYNTGGRGILIPHNRKAASVIDSMPQGSYRVIIDADKRIKKPTRSNMQNAYYWAVVIQYIVRAIEDSYTKGEIHEMLKFNYFGAKTIVAPSGFSFNAPAGETSKLKTDEMESFLVKSRAWGKDNLSLDIPLPNDCRMDY